MSDTITLYPSKLKMYFFLCLSSLFTIGGLWMISMGEFMGWITLIFFGLGCFVLIAVMLPNASYLKLTEKGFEFRTLFRTTFIEWMEVSTFEPTEIRTNKMVAFNYISDERANSTSSKLAHSMTGFDGALPDTYGKSAEDLSTILNQWREKFAK